jgi:hypothetical protein
MNPDMLSFSLKKSQQANPLHVPQWTPYGERYPLTGYFYVSLNISLYLSPRIPGKGAPSMFSNRVSLDSDTPSPEPLVCLFIHSFIHSFIYVCLPESPERSPPTIGGKNVRSPSTEPHADGRFTYDGVLRVSPRGSLMTLLSLPQGHAAFGTIPSTLAWVNQSPGSQHVLGTPIRVYPPQLLPPPT